MKKCNGLLICILFILTAVVSFAAYGAENEGSYGNFTVRRNDKMPYTDLSPDDRCYEDIKTAYSYGLIFGATEDEYHPWDRLTVADCIKMSSNLRNIYYTGRELELPEDGSKWYSEYIKYAVEKGIIPRSMQNFEEEITRGQFIGILANALGEETLTEINSVEDNSIPDVAEKYKYHDEIYSFYRAGIAIGTGGAFRIYPDAYIPRSEAAILLLRMADPSKRQRHNLTSSVTIYDDKGNSKIVRAADYLKYEEQGWRAFCEDVYSLGARTCLIPRNNRLAWLSEDWYSYPAATVYAPDGRSSVIALGDRDEWLSVGWYDHPVLTVYAPDGREEVISEKKKKEWLSVGWYDSPFITVYSRDGRTSKIPESEKEAWLDVGWYANKIIPMPPELSEQNHTITDIPVVSIGTGGQAVSGDKEYTPCEVNLFNIEEDKALFAAKGGIRLRGNASRSANPYRIKFDEKHNMLGLNGGAKAKSWVLLNYPDGPPESIKNDIAFRMGRMLLEPDGAYSSDGQFVHVYLNGEFAGLYLLCEQSQVNKHRVNVNEPEDGYKKTDVGYLVEIDNYSEPPYFRMNYENAYVADITGKMRKLRPASYAIKSDTYSKEQEELIGRYVSGVFRIVFEACEKGNYLTFDKNYEVVQADYKNAYDTVSAVMDLNSVVDMYILYEIMHDNDVGEGSFFMCVDFSEESRHPKLTFTAPWDFNWSCMNEAAGRFYASAFCEDSFMRRFGDRSNPWFIILYKQDWFRELVSQKWTSIGGSAAIAECTAGEARVLDKYEEDINCIKASSVGRGKYYLNWIDTRAEWLDGEWLQ